MPYELKRLVFDGKAVLPISGERFEAIRAARDAFLSLLGVEEKFDLLLACYQELEEALFSMSLAGMLFEHVGWSESIDNIQLTNRRLVALLSAGRLYEEQVEHDVRGVYGRRSAATTAVATRLQEANTADLSFRVIDALRNYVQHRSLPVHRLALSSVWEGESDNSRRCVHTIDPQIEVDRLRGDRRFDQSLLDQLPSFEGRANIRPLLQQYIATLGEVHRLVRELTDPDVARWEDALLSAEREFVAEHSEGSAGLAAVYYEDDQYQVTQENVVYVFTEPIGRRRMLKAKNPYVSHYARHVVTNASRSDV